MYEAYYGLKAKPFQLNPDPSFYFDSKQHRRAKAYLEYGLHQNEGFIVVTGEIGAGKTTIVRSLLESLDKDKVVAAQIVSTQLDASDILRMVAAAFGVRFMGMHKADLLLTIEAFLLEIAHRGKRCLLIIDEAQNLTQRAVEELRMLSNFQYESHTLLQSFLIGQPEFRSIMLSPKMEQLRQRVIAACHIGPLNETEVRDYIHHRLRCAGYAGGPLFDESAHEALFLASGGIPRRINVLCDRLLLLGYLSERKSFDRDDVLEIVKEMGNSATDITSAASDTRLLPPTAIEEEFRDIPLEASHSDPEVPTEAGKSLASNSDRFIADRLLRIERGQLRLERSQVRLEHTNTLMLRVLQKFMGAARADNRDAESEQKLDRDNSGNP